METSHRDVNTTFPKPVHLKSNQEFYITLLSTSTKVVHTLVSLTFRNRMQEYSSNFILVTQLNSLISLFYQMEQPIGKMEEKVITLSMITSGCHFQTSSGHSTRLLIKMLNWEPASSGCPTACL